MPSKLRPRIATAMLLAAALLAPAAASQAAPATGLLGADRADARVAPTPSARVARRACPNADVMPQPGNLTAVRQAILCLHNRIRARRGLVPLRENARLRRAAAAHSRDMVTHGYFAHTSPTGVTMVDRIMAAHYVSPRVGWALGENLAWGTGSLATPRAVMAAWMNSPGHRANILRRAFREIGIGVVIGVPSGDAGGATYTADFGVVRR